MKFLFIDFEHFDNDTHQMFVFDILVPKIFAYAMSHLINHATGIEENENGAIAIHKIEQNSIISLV